MAEKTGTSKRKNEKAAGAVEKANPETGKCEDRNCPVHGTLSVRGRVFEGTVVRKFPKRVMIEFEKSSYIRKYERYSKYTSKIHARLPECMEDEINVGDYIQIRECRPLSKLIHFVVVKKIREGTRDLKKSKFGRKSRK